MKIKNSISVAISGAVFLAVALLLVVPDVFGGVLILMLLATPVLWFLYREHYGADVHYRLFCAACAFYFLSCLLSFAMEVSDSREMSDLDLPIRFLLLPVVGHALFRVRLNLEWIGYGLVLCTGAAFVFALYERFLLNELLAKGGTSHHILFGGMSVVCAVAALNWPYRWPWLSLVGFALGLGAAVLSTSRGAWIALPIIALLQAWYYRRFITARQVVLVAGLGLVGVAIVVMIPESGVVTRIEAAISDVKLYFFHNDHTTSLGGRFEMWKGALVLIQEQWFLGYGLEQYTPEIIRLQEAGVIRDLHSVNMHPHNDLLSAMVARGFVGLVSYAALLLVPGVYFFRVLFTKGGYCDSKEVAFAFAGLNVLMVFFIAGLSESLFERNLSVNLFVFLISLLYLAIHQSRNATASHR